MRGAIMQPYFFPYIGYYQLAYEVEKFVFLDDVNYIKKGYINRNAILLNGKRHEFSVPVSKISQNRAIRFHDYTGDYSDFMRLIEQAYKKAPLFDMVMPLIKSVVLDSETNVARKNAKSLVDVFAYLGLERKFLFASDVELDSTPKGQERILALCKNLRISQYRNAIGGQGLYNAQSFNALGIDLKFIQPAIQPYPQGRHDFVSHLSMIDLLMHCDKASLLRQLCNYSLV